MKQTQTKLFDFSDVGLDFCAGSKSLFPDRFKRMLALGYNSQTVASVSVAGNQVTFEYGITHGYVADRVLKVSSGPLAAINGGEFVVDSVTTTSLTMTIDAVPISVAGGFTTIVASLGWNLVYEQNHIHIYKFKHIDDSELFLRLCFQDQASRRNCISPCIGRSFDATTGIITDADALTDTKEIVTPNDRFKWELQQTATSTFNISTYSTGFSTFGKGCVIGSIYHLFILSNKGNATHLGAVNGFAPVEVFNYSNLNFPVLIGSIDPASITTSGTNAGQDYATLISNGGAAYLGNIRVNFQTSMTESFGPTKELFLKTNSVVSYLPSNIDTFNTTTAKPLPIYERTTSQFLGYTLGGLFECHFSTSAKPSQDIANSPSIVYEIDFSHKAVIHSFCSGNSVNSVSLAFPLEIVSNGN